MLVVETTARIRREHLGKEVPIKQIARELRLSPNTVRKVVRSDETSFRYERKVQPLPKLGPWVEELERRLEADEEEKKRERVSLLRIFEALGELGYRGGYDAVRRYAKGWRRRRGAVPASQAYVPLVFAPGEAYQFDWSHEQVALAGSMDRAHYGAVAAVAFNALVAYDFVEEGALSMTARSRWGLGTLMRMRTRAVHSPHTGPRLAGVCTATVLHILLDALRPVARRKEYRATGAATRITSGRRAEAFGNFV